ncbi:MAG TPA: pyruvate:ferredoxin (flavodoxin) oxidoreductase, partial [Planctomycetes bacterium]|nr:pyruvate:ferredoxin (flavodoxin) oxidoreductase [Planctomycetota bacterium]
SGSVTTTFTASQGLLLMIPNMYKIAGELTSTVFHIAARTVATHALSIFGDHSDVMACRGTGFAMLCSSSVQEAHDFALIAQSASLESRIPFLHFFDGFRTSHEIQKIERLDDETLRKMLNEERIHEHRMRALSPDRPVLRGAAQNPDTFFQAREASNPFYAACPSKLEKAFRVFEQLTGRSYDLVSYHGDPEASRVIVLMGSGAETVRETVDYLCAQGEKVGMIKVNLFRPFPELAFLRALPAQAEKVAVLDRTKEPGSIGEPLYQDVLTALHQAPSELRPNLENLQVVGGRYGLSSKEFTPAMVNGIFQELCKKEPKRGFTIGIVDDVSQTSLSYDSSFDIEREDVVRSVFFGLGSDGTVGANKNSIKIIGEKTGNYAQGYFVYDSKKAGAVTVSHLRFGPRPIHSTYLIQSANFIGCHQFQFLDKFEMLDRAAPGATFLLNAPYGPEEVWDQLPLEVQQTILEKKLRFFIVDAYKVAKEAGLGPRINTVMQTCFFQITGILPGEEASEEIKKAIQKTYGKRGEEVVRRNCLAVDLSLANLHEVQVPTKVTTDRRMPPTVPDDAPDFVQSVTAVMLAGKGDALPVSAFPPDGTWPLGTTKWEKRNIAQEIPIWDKEVCIQCNQCAFVCPHTAIRAKVYDPALLAEAPAHFESLTYKGKDFKGQAYTIQVAPEDCTGCRLCVEVCPAKNKENPKFKAINMQPQLKHVDIERENFDFFLELPEPKREQIGRLDGKGSQFLEPLFEFSGACPGCGETPYIKLLTQLFGDRLLIANATGCSSIYGGNLPTTPYCTNDEGRGPAWSNSLFEDNAEFGLGFRLAVDSLEGVAKHLLRELAEPIGPSLVDALLSIDQRKESGIFEARELVADLKKKLLRMEGTKAQRLFDVADYLVRKSVWILGGDGWAYDIGYGGVDHVLSMERDINLLVMDTQVYSNTGGQQSKATPLGAAAKFAVAGRGIPKKDLGREAMSYDHVYIAQVAFGSKINQTVEAFKEAESWPGPSLIIAYSPCVAHGYDLAHSADQMAMATDTGFWPLYRYDPRRLHAGEAPLKLDSRKPRYPVSKFMENETRFRMVQRMDPGRYQFLQKEAQRVINQEYAYLEQLAGIKLPSDQSASNPEGTDSK